jgi:hypothetical protein
VLCWKNTLPLIVKPRIVSSIGSPWTQEWTRGDVHLERSGPTVKVRRPERCVDEGELQVARDLHDRAGARAERTAEAEARAHLRRDAGVADQQAADAIRHLDQRCREAGVAERDPELRDGHITTGVPSLFWRFWKVIALDRPDARELRLEADPDARAAVTVPTPI